MNTIHNKTIRFLIFFFGTCPLLQILVACSGMKPDLASLYAIEEQGLFDNRMQAFQPPVIVIPGIVSSSLIDQHGKEVWFGSLRKLLFSDYENLALEIDTQTLLPKPSPIRASEIPKKALIFDFFGSLFEILEKYGNYKLTEPGTPYEKHERRYYKFPYDWRYDNVVTAGKLDALIEQIRKDYGMPDLKVDFIAHSMGGLLARYYMRYGTADVLDDNDFPVTQAGAKKVRRLVQLGAPNLGTISALHQLINGYKVLLNNSINVEVVATMPSAYQLLPHPLNQWLIDINGRPIKKDLYDIQTWRNLQWGIFNPKTIKRIKKRYDTETEGQRRVALLHRYFEKHIERARRFVWSLTVPVKDPEYSIIAFGGNCQPTPARVLAEKIDGESFIRLSPKEIQNPLSGVNYKRLMLAPGDGRVTKPSVLARDFLDPAIARHRYSFIPLNYAFFLCHNHGQLTGNINFQDNLLNILLEKSHAETRRAMSAP